MYSQRASACALGLLAATGALVAAGPCDIYAAGNTPCVAAHSTTRALYSNYTGSLYQVQRGSDNTTTDIAPLSAGGVADAAAQDTFCAGTTCLISILYDQSGRSNHLTQAPPGGFSGPDAGGYDNLASATAAPVTLNGHKAYGVFVSPGTGYRNNEADGTATGDDPEGLYAVLDGTHYNGACCFDYGNAETNSLDTGNGHMEAIYYGSAAGRSPGDGSGPWIMADLENGLFAGNTSAVNTANPSVSWRFATAAVKGGPDQWAIRGADATAASDLSTFYSGARPDFDGYNPMSKEGAIILGIGGDNSNGAQGTFYEGVLTAGYPTDAVEDKVQANVAAAQYAPSARSTGPDDLLAALAVGASVSLRAATTTTDAAASYLAHNGSTVVTAEVSAASSAALRQQASWTVRAGLADSDCISFESVDAAGSYLRHFDFVLQLDALNATKQFQEDATFCIQAGLSNSSSSSSSSNDTGTFRSWNYPTRFFRQYSGVLYTASNGGVRVFDDPTSFNDDVSWVVGDSLA